MTWRGGHTWRYDDVLFESGTMRLAILGYVYPLMGYTCHLITFVHEKQRADDVKHVGVDDSVEKYRSYDSWLWVSYPTLISFNSQCRCFRHWPEYHILMPSPRVCLYETPSDETPKNSNRQVSGSYNLYRSSHTKSVTIHARVPICFQVDTHRFFVKSIIPTYTSWWEVWCWWM